MSKEAFKFSSQQYYFNAGSAAKAIRSELVTGRVVILTASFTLLTFIILYESALLRSLLVKQIDDGDDLAYMLERCETI